MTRACQDDYRLQFQVVKACFISTAKDNANKNPKQLEECQDTTRDAGAPIFASFPFFPTWSEFSREIFSVHFYNLLGKHGIFGKLRGLIFKPFPHGSTLG